MRKGLVRKIIIVLVIGVLGFFGNVPVFASSCCDKLGLTGNDCTRYEEMTGCNDSADTRVNNTLSSVINTLLFIAGIISVIMIMYGGFTYMTSAGNAAKVSKGKTILIYSIVGLVISVLAYAIVRFVLKAI